MKKISAIVAIIVVLLGLITPKIVSMQYAKGLQDLVDSVDQHPLYQANITKLESNWFSSYAEIDVGSSMSVLMDASSNGFSSSSTSLIISAKHGPVLWAENFALGWLYLHAKTSDKLISTVLSVNENAPLYEYKAYTRFNRQIEFSDRIAAFTFVDEASKSTVEFFGLKGSGTLSNDAITYLAQADNMSISVDDSVMLNISDVQAHINAQTGIQGLLEGGLFNSILGLKVGNMNFTSLIDNTQNIIDDFSFSVVSAYENEESNGLGKVSSTVGFGLIDMGTLSMEDLLMEFEINNIQQDFVRAYRAFSERSLELVKQQDGPQKLQQASEEFLQTHLVQQLQSDPEFNLRRFSGKIDGDAFNGQVLSKLVDIQQLPTPLTDNVFWLEHTHLEAQLNMQKKASLFAIKQILRNQLKGELQFALMSPEDQETTLNQQAEAGLSNFIEQGMLVKNNDDYSFSFVLKNKKAELNGKPIPL